MESIGYISIFVITLHILINLVKYYHIIYKKSEKRELIGSYINEYYEISGLLEMLALEDILNIIAPCNISVIPKYSIFGSWAGMTINN